MGLGEIWHKMILAAQRREAPAIMLLALQGGAGEATAPGSGGRAGRAWPGRRQKNVKAARPNGLYIMQS